MKKFILLLMLNLLLTTSNLFANNVNYSMPINKKQIVQEQSLKAYIYWQNEWHQGYISISNGVLSSYQFDDLNDRINTGNPLTGYFQANERFIALNQNSQLALKYNFTHFVDFRGYRAYIIAN